MVDGGSGGTCYRTGHLWLRLTIVKRLSDCVHLDKWTYFIDLRKEGSSGYPARVTAAPRTMMEEREGVSVTAGTSSCRSWWQDYSPRLAVPLRGTTHPSAM